FSLANAAWWQKLPFPNPKEIVAIGMTAGSTEPSDARMSGPEFLDFRSRQKSLKAIAAFEQRVITLSSKGSPGQRYNGASVSTNLFSFLSVKPILGRDFTVADEK